MAETIVQRRDARATVKRLFSKSPSSERSARAASLIDEADLSAEAIKTGLAPWEEVALARFAA